jgi:hypothetical protein
MSGNALIHEKYNVMKRWLPYILGISILFLAQSCSKGVLSGDRQVRSSDIVGQWVLTESADNSGSGWYYYKTGLERGVFTFYNNNGAEYEDGYNQMTGLWDIATTSGGYYDQYGKYRNDLHQTLEIHVDDRFTNNSIDLYFDDVSVTNSNIIATSYKGNTVSRYIFSRNY